jgi:hypothetical protein
MHGKLIYGTNTNPQYFELFKIFTKNFFEKSCIETFLTECIH